MAQTCGPNEYWDEKRQKCRKKIIFRRKGIYGPNFLSEPQAEQYSKIKNEEKTESPQLVDLQMSGLNSVTTRENPAKHEAAHNDLHYAESLNPERKKDPPGEKKDTIVMQIGKDGSYEAKGLVYDKGQPIAFQATGKGSRIKTLTTYKPDPPGELSNIEWHESQVAYDERQGKIADRGGDIYMAGPNDVTPEYCASIGKEFVAGHPSSFDGKHISVRSYCRDKKNNVTPADRKIFSENGRKDKGRTWKNRVVK